MSDTPETDAEAVNPEICSNLDGEATVSMETSFRGDYVSIDFARKLERQRDENKRGWDRASLAALDLEQRLKRAEKCILAIEKHYREKSPLTYSASTLAELINEWRGL
jgi:hypothetical protein